MASVSSDQEDIIFSPVGESSVPGGLPSDHSSDSTFESAASGDRRNEKSAAFPETASSRVDGSSHQNYQVSVLKSSWSAADAETQMEPDVNDVCLCLQNGVSSDGPEDSCKPVVRRHRWLWRTRLIGQKSKKRSFPFRLRASQSVKSMEVRMEERKRVRYDAIVRQRVTGLQKDVDRLTVHNLVLRDALREAKDSVIQQPESPKWSSESPSPQAVSPLPDSLPPPRSSPMLKSVSEMRRTLASLEESLAACHRDRQQVAFELKRTKEEKESLQRKLQTSTRGFPSSACDMGCGCNRAQALQVELSNSRQELETLKSESDIKVKYLTDTGVRWKSERDEAIEEKQLLNQQIEALFFCINKKDESIFVMCNNFFKMKLAKESTEEELLRLMMLHNKILDKVLDQLNDVNEDNSYLIHNLNQLAKGGESDFDRRLTDVMRQKVGHELDKYRLLKEKNRLTLEVACLSTENDRLQWELEEVKRAVLPPQEDLGNGPPYYTGLTSHPSKPTRCDGDAKAGHSTSSGSYSDRSDTRLLRNQSSSGCSLVDGGIENNSIADEWQWVNEASDLKKKNRSNDNKSAAEVAAKTVMHSPRRHSVPGIRPLSTSHQQRVYRDGAQRTTGPLGVRSEAGPIHLDPHSESATHQRLKKAFGISCDVPRYLSSMSALSTQGDLSTSLADLVNLGAPTKRNETRCRAGVQSSAVAAATNASKCSGDNVPKAHHFWSWWKHLSTAR